MSKPDYQIDIRPLDEFSPQALYALLKLRVDVFVVEQKCPYPELDGLDLGALHIRLIKDDLLFAAARILRPLSIDAPAKIGRVVVAPNQRGKKLGDAVMRAAIAACEQSYPKQAIYLSAQHHLSDFYFALGFTATSDVYLEDGIPHIDMMRAPA